MFNPVQKILGDKYSKDLTKKEKRKQHAHALDLSHNPKDFTEFYLKNGKKLVGKRNKKAEEKAMREEEEQYYK